VLGGENESCTRRADCAPGFSCFNQRCTMGDSGDGGDGNTPTPTLGARGETCLVSSDCEAGLVCRPSAAVGVCTDADSGVAPTGNVCGAECRTPEDCCELPIELHQTLGTKSCTELDDLLDGVDCGATMMVLEQQQCFARDAYCECEADAWACNQGACLYVASCSADGLEPGGCPPLTRTGRMLVSTCDVRLLRHLRRRRMHVLRRRLLPPLLRRSRLSRDAGVRRHRGLLPCKHLHQRRQL
jgi:hypothetical protein